MKRLTILFFLTGIAALTVHAQVVDTYHQLPVAHQHLMLTILDDAFNDEHGSYWVHSGDTIRKMEDAILKYFEDNGISEVCGVPLGASYEQAERILREKYGKCDFQTSTKECLSYRNKLHEEIKFSGLSFMFRSDGESCYFDKAEMKIEAKTKEDAVRLKKSIDEKLKKRYKIYTVLDEGKNHLSIGGISPVTTNEENGGYAFSVDIQKHDKPTKDGSMYSVRLVYGPFDNQ